jgi:hypothetical protein
MKLMKHITIALVLCAIPAMAFGQDVSCDGCTHEVSVYMGEGGLIATADGAEMVTYVASCEGVTRSGELMANADGVVATLLTMDNGLACSGDDEDNMFQLGPIMDGGWFWITDDMNSAVGNLVSQDVLDNETTDITGTTSVTMTEGKGAVYLKETSSGRVGILPNILPEMTMEPAAVNNCSFTTSGTTHTRETTACMLGDGRTSLLVQGPTNIFTGKRDPLGANAMVTRPVSGSVTVVADLWGNGSGHFTTDAAGDARLGHPGGTRLPAMISAVLVGDGAAADTPIESSEVGGMTLDAATTTSLGELTIGADSAYCGTTANHTATVKFTATIASDMDRDVVTPSIVAGDRGAAAGVAATHTIMVVCPSASADMGQELVPENPFPVE